MRERNGLEMVRVTVQAHSAAPSCIFNKFLYWVCFIHLKKVSTKKKKSRINE